MTINWKLWNKPETGGVLLSLLFLSIFFFFILFSAIIHYRTTQEEIKLINKQVNSLTEQISNIDSYTTLGRQEPQKFKIFKKKKWMAPLTREYLNEALHSLQKQSNVTFLSINPQNISDPNNITNTTISLNIQVIKDQHFFNFLQKLEAELPGIVRIKKFELRRAKELNSHVIQKISNGEQVSLFEGNIDFELEYKQFIKQPLNSRRF